MAIFEQHPRTRWAVPVGVLALVGGTALATGSAQADSGLAPKTAEQLLVDVQSARVETYSGTVAAQVDLGLGNVTGLTKRATSFQNLVDGSSTLRVWADGPQRQRLALVGDAGEADVVRNGRSVWTWNAQERTATRATLPEPDAEAKGATKTHAHPAPTTGPHAGATAPATPQEAAELALAHLDPTTKVTANGQATVAGRPAYELVLTPRTGETLVRRVVLDLDAETSMPLRVRVDGSNPDKPAVDIGFTSFSLAKPDAARLTFTPPAGTTVTTKTAAPVQSTKDTTPKAAGHPEPVRVGSGWATVTLIRLPADAVARLGSPAAAKDATGATNPATLLAALPKQTGAWGSGRVLEGTLFSAVLTDDGRLATGAVPASTLTKALTSTPLAK